MGEEKKDLRKMLDFIFNLFKMLENTGGGMVLYYYKNR